MVYILMQYIWNGTVLIKTVPTVFGAYSLAKTTMEKLKSECEKADFRCTFEILESNIYFSEEEIPVLN